MNNERINEILGVREAFELPEKLLKSVLENNTKLYDVFISEEPDLEKDLFNEYYQTEHGDRDKLKQDFTPQELAYLVNCLAGEGEKAADICAGTGTLTINNWKIDKNRKHHIEEYSSRALPILLFNLAIRNINAEVWHMDVLSREVFGVYEVKQSEKYSTVTKIEKEYSTEKQDIVVMNPPYSLKWDGKNDERFEEYGVAPKSKADFAFLLHGLNMLKENGTLIAILPHGVLFRGAAEGKIRQKLIEEGIIYAVIGLPEKLFLNTGIPTCILILKKQREGRDVLFIDASKQFKKVKKQSEMTEEHIDYVLNLYNDRKTVEKQSYLASFEDIKDNDFNLNIPRYVDTFEPEKIEPLDTILKELINIGTEIKKTEEEFYEMFMQLESEEGLDEEKKLLRKYMESEKTLESKREKILKICNSNGGQLIWEI